MKAIRVEEHGGPEVLRICDVPDPVLEDGHAIVAVRAAALNHLDIWLRRGVPGHRFPLPMTPGSEAAGVIADIGPNDAGWKDGDEVIVAPGYSCGLCAACLRGEDPFCPRFGIFGETSDGTDAGKILVPIRNLIARPASLSFEEAAAIPLDMLTAWHMLVSRARIRPGEVVLIQAGGSGVGTAAIQIARLWGATVYTTVGSPAKAALARTLGAHEVIEYRQTDFASEIRRLTGKRGVDVVIEHIGGETFERSLRALTRGGRLVTCGSTASGEATLNLRLVFFKQLSILGSTMGSLGELHEVMRHVGTGSLRPIIDRILPFEDVAEGHRVLESREAFGKVVLQL